MRLGFFQGQVGAVFFFWRQSEGGTNAGWCISGGNQSHLLDCVARKEKHSRIKTLGWSALKDMPALNERAHVTVHVSMLET
jgi:hypothetical protein